MKADAISNTVNVSRWDRDFKMAPGPQNPYATTDYDGDNPLRLAKKIDAALDKYGLGKRTPLEGELLETMTQQCRVRCWQRSPSGPLGRHQLDLVEARSSSRAADVDAARPQLWWKSTGPIGGSA
jgi:hypothetical protein